MGNSFRTHFAHIVVSILLFVACFLMVACNVDEPRFRIDELLAPLPGDQVNEVSDTGQGGGPEGDQVTARIHCPDARRDDCGLLVNLLAVDNPITLNVRLRIDEGITFRSDYNEAVTFEEGGLEGRITQVSLMPQERREILFPYQLNGPVMPGAYKVEIIATDAQTNEVYGDTLAYVYIYLDDEGEYQLLSTKADYENRFLNGFVDGTFGVSYKIILEQKDQPRKGSVLLRVDSDQEDYAPIIGLTSTGGINFISDIAGQNVVSDFGMTVTRNFPEIDSGGARIASFPFIYDRDGQILEGIYALILAIDPETENERREESPVAFRVVSDPNYRDERWLSITRLEPKVLDTVSNRMMTPRIIADPPGGKPTPDAATAQQLCDTEWRNATFPPGTKKPPWNFRISDFNDTLCQLYAVKYAGQVFISWDEFSRYSVQMNDNISDPEQVLVDHEIYLMPRPNNVP